MWSKKCIMHWKLHKESDKLTRSYTTQPGAEAKVFSGFHWPFQQMRGWYLKLGPKSFFLYS
jgi:hypothetical protein